MRPQKRPALVSMPSSSSSDGGHNSSSGNVGLVPPHEKVRVILQPACNKSAPYVANIDNANSTLQIMEEQNSVEFSDSPQDRILAAAPGSVVRDVRLLEVRPLEACVGAGTRVGDPVACGHSVRAGAPYVAFAAARSATRCFQHRTSPVAFSASEPDTAHQTYGLL